MHAHLKNFEPDTSDYYQAILQNLFFATLNTPINQRTFSTHDNRSHRDSSKYRYADLLQSPDTFLQHLKHVPFVNGGLFDCLDTFEATGDGGVRIDCFSDNKTVRQKLHVPAKLFFDKTRGLFPLFAHYKFTVEENTPIEQEVALDPELLGQIFENLLGTYNPETQSTARKATGSYYTPRQIVDYMVDEALSAYLLQNVKPYDGDTQSLEERLREDLLAYESQGNIDEDAHHLIHDTEIHPLIQAIDALKIIDPAVGSGAFAMGILNKLVLILRKLDPQNQNWKQRQLQQAENIPDVQSRESAKQAIEAVFSKANHYNDYGRKLYLIQNGLYGIDIQPIAVTIAKLRFFISLIIEQIPNQNPDDNYGIRPLPNLETKFVAANTLIGLKEVKTSEFQQRLAKDEIQVLRQKIHQLRTDHFSAATRPAKREVAEKEEACRQALIEALLAQHNAWKTHQQNRISQEVAQLPKQAARQKLREQRQKEYTVREKKLTASVEEAQKIANWNPYNQNAVADFFEPAWMFGIHHGFHIVIGNPPYIRHEKIRHLKPALQTHFGDFFSSTADISVYFYKRGAELLREGGLLTYICTNKFMRSGYGKKLRQFLTADMALKTILDFGSLSVFDAAVNASILLVQKSPPTPNHTLRATTLRHVSDEFNVRKAFQTQAFPMQLAHLSSEEWTLARTETLALLQKLQHTGTSFSESIQGKFYFGIKTGCNDAFIIDEAICQQLIAEDAKSAQLIKPLLRGRNLRKWKAVSANEHLIAIASSANKQWPWSNAASESEAEQIFEKTYPAIYRHLIRYKERLLPRDNQGKFYWELRSCAYYDAFEKPKIVYPEIAKSLYACYDTTGAFGLKTTYALPTEDLSLLGILSSTIFDWYARYSFGGLGDAWAGGELFFFARHMEKAPIANRTEAQKAALSRLVAQLLAEPNGDAVNALEKEIDTLVYQLYSLTPQEIQLIEQTYRDAGMTV